MQAPYWAGHRLSTVTSGYFFRAVTARTPLEPGMPHPCATLDPNRWRQLWQRLGGEPPADSFAQVQSAYRQTTRHYHSERHILACLAHLDRFRALAADPDALELALWLDLANPRSGRQSCPVCTVVRGDRGLPDGGPAAVPRTAASVAAHLDGVGRNATFCFSPTRLSYDYMHAAIRIVDAILQAVIPLLVQNRLLDRFRHHL